MSHITSDPNSQNRVDKSTPTGILVPRPDNSGRKPESVTSPVDSPLQSTINNFLDKAQQVGAKITSAVTQLLEDIEATDKMKS